MAGKIKKYNSKGNMIYYKNSDGYEFWYNENGNIIHSKSPTGYEQWNEYDKYHYNIFYLNTKDLLYWRKYPFFKEYHHKILFL
jgi:hypothetical protein